jgi:hypothetical protein
MTGNGALINPTGTFAIGNSSTNITFNGTTLKLNGNVVGPENMAGGATLPGYVRVYTGGTILELPNALTPINTWGALTMDTTALVNTIGAVDANPSATLFQAGSYYYELTVPIKNTNSDTNVGVFTALGVSDGSFGYTILSYAGAALLGDWQTLPITGVGRFTLSTAQYVFPLWQTADYPVVLIRGFSGFSTVIWKVWKA